MPVLATAAAWLCAAALGSVTVEGNVGLAARGREVRLEGLPSRSAGELELVPRLALLRPGRLDFALSYAPRLTLPVDLSAGAPELSSASRLRDAGEVLHRGDLTIVAAATPTLSLRLGAAAAYGRIELLRTDLYRADVLPATGRLAWRSALASVGATATPTPRTTLTGALEGFEIGGGDAAARAVVALQRGARLETALRHGASRRDELSLTGDAAWSRFSPATSAEHAAIVRLGGGWSRQLGPPLAARVATGAAWSYSDPPAAAAHREIAPFAEAGLTHAPPRPLLRTELAVRMSPYMNPLTGAVDQRIEGTATATWRATHDWELAGRAGAAATRAGTSHGAFWTGERLAELASLDLRASWAFAQRATLSARPWWRRQRSHDLSVPTFVEWGAAIEVGWGARWPG